jgi:hypothetical protein
MRVGKVSYRLTRVVSSDGGRTFLRQNDAYGIYCTGSVSNNFAFRQAREETALFGSWPN